MRKYSGTIDENTVAHLMNGGPFGKNTVAHLMNSGTFDESIVAPLMKNTVVTLMKIQ